jgi:hypothetical protein
VYWGVYNMVERPDNDFAAGYFGGDKDNWFFRNHGGSPASVNPTRWNYLVGPLASKPMSDAQNYQEMQQHLNVQSFADYILTSFYVGMTDWPVNNCKRARLLPFSNPPNSVFFSACFGTFSKGAAK